MRAMAVLMLAALGCGAAEPATESPEVTIAPPPRADATAKPQAPPPLQGDGCLVVAEPYQLDFPHERLEQSRKRRAEEEAARPRHNPCVTDDRSPDCRYHQARLHFEAHRYDLAAKGFREIAMEANAEIGEFAAQLALESLNQLGTRAQPPRTACFDLIAKDSETYFTLYCGPIRLADEETCNIFARIKFDVRRMGIEKLVQAADAGPPNDSIALYKQAGDGYRALFKDACESGVPASKRQGYRCEELIYNAYRSYRAARRVVEANEARSTLLDPRHGLDRTELAKKVASEPPLTPP